MRCRSIIFILSGGKVKWADGSYSCIRSNKKTAFFSLPNMNLSCCLFEFWLLHIKWGSTDQKQAQTSRVFFKKKIKNKSPLQLVFSVFCPCCLETCFQAFSPHNRNTINLDQSIFTRKISTSFFPLLFWGFSNRSFCVLLQIFRQHFQGRQFFNRWLLMIAGEKKKKVK